MSDTYYTIFHVRFPIYTPFGMEYSHSIYFGVYSMPQPSTWCTNSVSEFGSMLTELFDHADLKKIPIGSLRRFIKKTYLLH